MPHISDMRFQIALTFEHVAGFDWVPFIELRGYRAKYKIEEEIKEDRLKNRSKTCKSADKFVGRPDKNGILRVNVDNSKKYSQLGYLLKCSRSVHALRILRSYVRQLIASTPYIAFGCRRCPHASSVWWGFTTVIDDWPSETASNNPSRHSLMTVFFQSTVFDWSK